jgi:hypothetical protein
LAGPALRLTQQEHIDAARERVEVLGAMLRRREILDMLDDRHHDEWELVHGAYGVEELPSQLDARHERERATLEKRLDLLPPKPGEFASLDEFMRASEPLLQNEIAAGSAEIRSMLDAEIREDIRLWAGDWIDDEDLAQAEAHHKEVRSDVEQRIADYQPLRGEFASLDDFMRATEHLAEHEEAEITPEALHDTEQATNLREARPAAVSSAAEIEAASIRDGEAAEVMPEAPRRGFFSFWGAAENFFEDASRTVHMARSNETLRFDT